MDFNSEKTWQNYDPENQVQMRLDKTLEMIPKGVSTILDVGCGNGIITNALAGDYLLIGVPNCEQLEKKLSRCAVCGHTYHVDGHLRSLGLADLDSFSQPDYERKQYSIFGPRNRDFPPILLALKHKLGQWAGEYPGSVCPKCGSTDFLHESNLPTKFINAANVVITRPRPYWLLALYRKK